MTRSGGFDYVIVGAGTAGSLLASRLSASTPASVLLLEAGPPATDPRIYDPPRFPELFESELDYRYVTTNQENGTGQVIRWPRGRVVGGSGAINAMIHLRGRASDFDGWGTNTDADWSFTNVLPIFRAMEHTTIGDDKLRGREGPLPVSIAQLPHELSNAFFEAALSFGHPANDDLNGYDVIGVGWNQMNIEDGRRVNTASAFLEPAQDRPSLTLKTGCTVTRLKVAGTRAVGVFYDDEDGTHEVDASEQVILCAGTIGSAALLLHSGIGPAQRLGAVGKKVIADLPGVGQNLQDHPGVRIVYRSRSSIQLSERNHNEVGLFAELDLGGSTGLTQWGFSYLANPRQYRVSPRHEFSFYPSWSNPTSRGELTIDDHDKLRIDPRYLQTERDLRGLVAAVRHSRELANQPALRRHIASETMPGVDLNSQKELAEYVRSAVNTWYHPVGTCAMGEREDSVVDTDLRVRGVDNLMIADASVMPQITSTNTNAATAMIAWRAADLLTAESRRKNAARDLPQ